MTSLLIICLIRTSIFMKPSVFIPVKVFVIVYYSVKVAPSIKQLSQTYLTAPDPDKTT